MRFYRSEKMPKKHKFDDVNFHLDLGDPPEEVLEWSRKHLGENEEEKSMKLYELREMIFGAYKMRF